MGRVEDAMRRAEAARDGGGDWASTAIVEAELAEPVVAPEPAFARAEDDPTEVKAEPQKRGSIFEHLDARLAEKIVVDDRMVPAIREQYRRLAAALHHAQAADGLKVVMIASAVEKEGKSLTSSNLALTLSESYRRRVLLIDADLRRPSLHTTFNLGQPSGLSEALMSVEEQKLGLHAVSDMLTVLPAGRPSSDPMAALTSPRMRHVLQEARDAFDWVVIDTPPVGLLADANLLASMVDGTVLVVKAGATPFSLVKRAVEAIGPARVLGVVLNLASLHGREYGYGYYGYSYAAAVPRDKP
jgi:capsular exopolysaccharide synthesis family protein